MPISFFFFFCFFLLVFGGGENTRTKDTRTSVVDSAPAFTFSKGASAFPRTGTGHAALLFHAVDVSAFRKNPPMFLLLRRFRSLSFKIRVTLQNGFTTLESIKVGIRFL